MVLIKSVQVGDRIEWLGHFGVVKYVGLVEGYIDIWYGIDWDDETRGRHNGSLNGVQYFTTSYVSSGSFVRPDKVQSGQSAVSAITSRYGQRDDEASAKIMEQQLLNIQQSINAPFVQLIGFEKVTDRQSDFNNLQIINLRLQNVCSIGELTTLCSNVMELDISKNLLTSWLQIFDVCNQLKHLEWLNVSENLLNFPSDYEAFKFEQLRFLICGSMRLEWDTVKKLGQIFLNLEELRVPHNKITVTECCKDNFLSLKLLDLEDNKLNDWSQVCKLSSIETLEHLNLENTGIKKIRFECRDSILKNLKKAVISHNLIEDWESLGELNKLPKFEDLRFLKNPIMDTETYATCIQLIIARIGNLKVFNGAVIKPEERKGAEYDYIKKYGLEWLSARSNLKDRISFIARHNRYDELIQKYGTPEESELIVQSKLIKVTLIEINFVHQNRIITKKLPPSILIQKLIMLAQRLFNIESRPTLTYISGIESDIEIELNDEGKELGFYSVQDGDKIIVKSC